MYYKYTQCCGFDFEREFTRFFRVGCMKKLIYLFMYILYRFSTIADSGSNLRREYGYSVHYFVHLSISLFASLDSRNELCRPGMHVK